MIATHIAKILLEDAEVMSYCRKDNIFTDTAPIGTRLPYIVVSSDARPADDDGVMSEFKVEVNIYDSNEDKRPMRKASRRIVNLLNYGVFLREDGEDIDATIREISGLPEYSHLRVWFRNWSTYSEGDSSLSRIYMAFDARAIENIED